MKSELAYTLEDYYKYEVEPPERILANPTSFEGELMSEDEIFEYGKDSLGVIRILEDRNPERSAELRKTFVIDCNFLRQIGRIDEEEYNMLMIEAGVAEK